MQADTEESALDASPYVPPPTLRKKIKVEKGEGLWLMSFSDMSLILMSFFILQLSFSTPDKRKYENVAEAMGTPKTSQNLKAIENELKAAINEQKLSHAVQVQSTVDGLVIELKDQILFESGVATISPKQLPTVDRVLGIIAKTQGRYKVIVEGHTDDVPIKKGNFSSNWELSAARGISLLHSFRERGLAEEQIAIVARAQTQPKVAVTGLKGEALRKARAANRRVVIRIE